MDKYTLISFGYTYCPDICGFTLADIATTIRTLGPLGDMVQGLFFSIDPERDTPEVIAPYVANFSDRIQGLTGDPAEIARVATSFGVRYEPVAYVDGDYSMDHSTTIFLMGPGNRFIAQFRYNSGPERIAAAIRRDMERNGLVN